MSIEINREPFIVTAAIARPQAMNAINFDVMSRLEHLLDEIENDSGLRLFMLTGSGKSFVSGGDLKEFHQIKDAGNAKKMTRRMLNILDRIKNLPCWTLAVINGHTYGGGWEIALAFDFRIAVSSAKIGFTQGAFYLPPGWGGIPSLADCIGRSRALYWLASQKVITAGTALDAGFLQDVFEESTYADQLKRLKKKLTINNRTFIEYLKRENPEYLADETDPFSPDISPRNFPLSKAKVKWQRKRT